MMRHVGRMRLPADRLFLFGICACRNDGVVVTRNPEQVYNLAVQIVVYLGMCSGLA